MPTVIDSLLVTLGLDDTALGGGARRADATLRRLAGNQTARDRAQAEAEAKAAAERDARAKAFSDGINKVRNQAMALFAVFTAGKGLTDFIGSTVTGAANLGRLSENLGIGITDLSAWQRASERVGGSAESMAGQLKESADAIAKYKLGQGMTEGMTKFFQFGGNDADLKNGESYLLARSNIVKKAYDQDPTKGALLASQMGISEDQLGLIKRGAVAVLALRDAQKNNSSITSDDAKKAQVLVERWHDFTDGLQATAVKIAVSLIPAFTQVTNWIAQLATTISANKDVIAKWINDNVSKALPLMTQFVEWLKTDGWDKFIKGAKEVSAAVVTIADALRDAIKWYKEWKGVSTGDVEGDKLIPTTKEHIAKRFLRDGTADAKEGGIGFQIKLALARTQASLGDITSAKYVLDATGKDDYLWQSKTANGAFPKGIAANSPGDQGVPDELVKLGWSQAQASGITARLSAESGLDPAAKNPSSGMYGIAQWSASRRADFKKWSDMDIEGSSRTDQLKFLDYEMRYGKEKAAGDKIRATTTAAGAAAAMGLYERAGKDEPIMQARSIPIANTIEAAMRARNAAGAAAIPVGAAAAVPVRPAPAANAPSTTDVKVGAINVHTQATDAEGIARDIGGAVQQYAFVSQADSGMT